MKKSTVSLLSFSLLLLSLWSCSKKEVQCNHTSPNLPQTAYAYDASDKDKMAIISWMNIISTKNIQVNPITPRGIIIKSTKSGATLGRVIFYDNFSGINLSHSCSGCHNAPVVNHLAEATIHQQQGQPSVINTPNADARYQIDANADIHAQSGLSDLASVASQISSRPYYSLLFRDAYGSSEVTPERVSEALAQYLAAMASVDSKDAVASDPRFADPFK